MHYAACQNGNQRPGRANSLHIIPIAHSLAHPPQTPTLGSCRCIQGAWGGGLFGAMCPPRIRTCARHFPVSSSQLHAVFEFMCVCVCAHRLYRASFRILFPFPNPQHILTTEPAHALKCLVCRPVVCVCVFTLRTCTQIERE